jgi:hypothetical protein
MRQERLSGTTLLNIEKDFLSSFSTIFFVCLLPSNIRKKSASFLA